MHPGIEQSFQAADFQGFNRLRRLARDGDEAAARAVAQQFEALFISQLLSQMRDAAGLFGSAEESVGAGGMDTYHRLHDQQLALGMARGSRLGLADAILRQLGLETAAPSTSAAGTTLALSSRFAAPPPQAVRPPDPAAALEAAHPPGAASEVRDTLPFAPTDQAGFVTAVWPHARRAARVLGVSPQVLVAQSALETGWGRHQPRHPDGRDSFNLFGIKAGADWAGERVRVPTLEFVDGVPERRAAAFRAYDDLAAGFDDYVRFVTGSERYRAALAASSDAGYVQALAAGGYATDPRYAEKVTAILERGLPGLDRGLDGEPAGEPSGEPYGVPIKVSAAADDTGSRTATAVGGPGHARTAG